MDHFANAKVIAELFGVTLTQQVGFYGPSLIARKGKVERVVMDPYRDIRWVGLEGGGALV